MTAPPPLLSIVIEWENAGRIGLNRARRMLAALRAQLADEGTRHELIMLHDPAKLDRAAIAEAVREAGLDGPVRYAAPLGAGYYEQKNAGAALARGEIVVFLDSDVVPQPGWLGALTRPFADARIGVVGGTTFVDHDGLYSAAMALAWFFPLPGQGRGIAPSRTFFANNVAFRRGIFARHPFPETGQYRGQCAFLADALIEAGEQIRLSRDARVAHPPPQGLRQFLVRALWNGHDDRVRAGLTKGCLPAMTRDFLAAVVRIGRDHRRVGLRFPGAVAASLIATSYYALRFAAYFAAAAAPEWVRRSLSRADA